MHTALENSKGTEGDEREGHSLLSPELLLFDITQIIFHVKKWLLKFTLLAAVMHKTRSTAHWLYSGVADVPSPASASVPEEHRGLFVNQNVSTCRKLAELNSVLPYFIHPSVCLPLLLPSLHHPLYPTESHTYVLAGALAQTHARVRTHTLPKGNGITWYSLPHNHIIEVCVHVCLCTYM